MTMAQGASVRALASRINASVVREGLSLETVLRQSETPSPRDASLLRALCFGSLRWHHRLQWQASQLLTKPLKRGDGELAALIRMGLYQLQWLRVLAVTEFHELSEEEAKQIGKQIGMSCSFHYVSCLYYSIVQ